jgi:hypothetical protein
MVARMSVDDMRDRLVPDFADVQSGLRSLISWE